MSRFFVAFLLLSIFLLLTHCSELLSIDTASEPTETEKDLEFEEEIGGIFNVESETIEDSTILKSLKDFKRVGTPISKHSFSSESSPSPTSPELVKRFVVYDDQRYRPRGPSIHLTPGKPASKHVSFGWVQFSDDRMMPSEDMLDTPENREHIRVLMLADARHGNLEYFRYLVRVLERLNSRTYGEDLFENSKDSIAFELSFYNPDSLIFSAVHSDNVELFLEVMAFKGIQFSDLNPFKKPTIPQGSKDRFSPHSFPPKKRSCFLDDDDEESEDEGGEFELENLDETVFGQAIIQNSIEIVRLFLENGIKDEYPEGTETALHLAIQHGHEILVRILLDGGESRIDRVNGAFQTPAMTAIISVQPRILQLLIERGASLTIFDHDHKSVLHYAAILGNMEILVILRKALEAMDKYDRGALLNSVDIKRRSPLDLTANHDVYSFLINEMGFKP